MISRTLCGASGGGRRPSRHPMNRRFVMAVLLSLVVLVSAASGACGSKSQQPSSAADSGRPAPVVTPSPSWGSTPTEPDPAGPELAISVFLPLPIAQQTAAHGEIFRQSLRTIRSALPHAAIVGLFLGNQMGGPSDWRALLDIAQQEQFQVVIGFADVVDGRAEQGFRPTRTASTWQLGSLGDFFACVECATHPALYAVLALDEPWHPTKRPFYSTTDLQSLYQALKALSPSTRVMLAFSREIWRQMDNPNAQYTSGMADVVQISALEFQDGAYQ